MLVETRGTPMVMASMLSLSSATVTKTHLSSVIHHRSRGMREISGPTHPFSSLKIHLKAHRCGRPLVVVSRASPASAPAAALANVRFRLDNLGPQPGSRKKAKRKGGVYLQDKEGAVDLDERSEIEVRPWCSKGVRRWADAALSSNPELRGIAGGMHAGLPKYVPVNLKDIEAAGFQEGEEVSLESLKNKGLINPSGRERTLPLKILGDGELSVKLNFKARAFSASAREKLEAAGCSLTVLPGRKKWVKPSVAKNLARAEEYFAKKRAAADSGDGSSS
ncbi:hypothetical protein NMG60_11018954 [Bertholletia excelsa]